MSGSMTPQQMAQNAAAQNAQARALILRNAVKMTQRIFSQTFVPSSNSGVLAVQPRNVGMIIGFWVQLTGTVQNTGTVAIVPSKFNMGNAIAQFQFTDLNNYTRINTAGWHMSMLGSARGQRPFISSIMTDNPEGYGSNMPVMVIPASIAAGASGQVECWYYVPLAYSETDLRGIVYANIVSATMNLQLSVNPSVAVPFGTDSTLSIMVGAGAGACSAAFTTTTVNVYQEFYDQIPMGKNGAILPIQDLSTVYELKQTALTGMSAGQDFPIPYTNFRNFLSTTVVFDNGGVLNPGTDINYIALQSANFTNIFNVPPHLFGIWARKRIHTDFPSGVYYLDSRTKNINTSAYGNMELIFNPSVVNVGAQMLVGFEMTGQVNTLVPSGSLPAG
jgi:hypothetical protein